MPMSGEPPAEEFWNNTAAPEHRYKSAPKPMLQPGILSNTTSLDAASIQLVSAWAHPGRRAPNPKVCNSWELRTWTTFLSHCTYWRQAATMFDFATAFLNQVKSTRNARAKMVEELTNQHLYHRTARLCASRLTQTKLHVVRCTTLRFAIVLCWSGRPPTHHACIADACALCGL